TCALPISADGVSRRLPSLSFASKVLDRFADAGEPLEMPALPAGVDVEAEGAGDFLLAAVAAVKAAGVDPELVLRRALLERAGLESTSTCVLLTNLVRLGFTVRLSFAPLYLLLPGVPNGS